MKFLFDLFPVLLFFATYKLADIYVATAVAIVASLAQTAIHYYRHRRIESMHIITLLMVLVFGGATLWLHNEAFIKWKPSAVNWLLGLVFLLSPLFGKPLIQRLMGGVTELPATIWQRLNLAWALFFIASGFLNLYVAYRFDTDTWVNFKLFGLTALTIVFILAQSLFLARFIKEDPSKQQEES
ncbi:MAG: septation protein A [Gammaproteobacteria bacterium]|nr:septation protein A [Gammaproteobacteria bacterium]